MQGRVHNTNMWNFMDERENFERYVIIDRTENFWFVFMALTPKLWKRDKRSRQRDFRISYLSGKIINYFENETGCFCWVFKFGI